MWQGCKEGESAPLSCGAAAHHSSLSFFPVSEIAFQVRSHVSWLHMLLTKIKWMWTKPVWYNHGVGHVQRFRNQGLGPHRTPLKDSEKFLYAWATQQPHCYTTNVGNIIQDDSFLQCFLIWELVIWWMVSFTNFLHRHIWIINTFSLFINLKTFNGLRWNLMRTGLHSLVTVW